MGITGVNEHIEPIFNAVSPSTVIIPSGVSYAEVSNKDFLYRNYIMLALEQQMTFIMEIDRLKSIYRRTMVKSDNNRQENSAEHSWQIALSAQILQQYAEQKVDISRVTCMLLIHDIVEIDAGDLFAFEDPSLMEEQEQKEKKAAVRIFGLLPEEQSKKMLDLWLGI